MGVIQSSVNQAIGAIGATARDMKLLRKAGELTQNQKALEAVQKDIAQKALYTDEQKKQLRDAQLEQEEKTKLIAKIREQMLRERERQSSIERQSTISKIRNMKDLKERERLRNSPLGGDFNV